MIGLVITVMENSTKNVSFFTKIRVLFSFKYITMKLMFAMKLAQNALCISWVSTCISLVRISFRWIPYHGDNTILTHSFRCSLLHAWKPPPKVSVSSKGNPSPECDLL